MNSVLTSKGSTLFLWTKCSLFVRGLGKSIPGLKHNLGNHKINVDPLLEVVEVASKRRATAKKKY